MAMALSSANYTINEWLDAPFDAAHPSKRARPAVQTEMSMVIVLSQYAVLTLIGLSVAQTLGHWFGAVAGAFSIFGVIYNVPPVQAKE
jgi:4-hydroxybenzoate polyprenyltransferase